MAREVRARTALAFEELPQSSPKILKKINTSKRAMVVRGRALVLDPYPLLVH